MRPVSADVDLSAIRSNVAILTDLVAPARVCAVVKADGYGHGAVAAARAALAGGAHLLGVALVAEGAELRTAGIEAPILVLSQASVHELDDLVAQRLEATVYTPAGVADLGAAARRAGRGPQDPVPVHLKVDTGMRRVGVQPADAVALARAIVADTGLHLASVFTRRLADMPLNLAAPVWVDADKVDLGGHAAHGMTLKERFSVDAVGRADDGARPPFQVRNHPGTDARQVLCKIFLGDGRARLMGRPHDLAWV